MPTYPNLTPLPPAPNPDSPATFNALAYPFTEAQIQMVEEINAFIAAFEILISDAQNAALGLEGVNGQLRIPTLTGAATAAATALSPAMRAALALNGVEGEKRIPVMNGLEGAERAVVGATGLGVLAAATTAAAREVILAAVRNPAAGAVESYAFCDIGNDTDNAFGSIHAGSTLRPCGAVNSFRVISGGAGIVGSGEGAALSGTWVCLGQSRGRNTISDNLDSWYGTLFRRIS